jgi:hypothetical protein
MNYNENVFFGMGRSLAVNSSDEMPSSGNTRH